MEKCKMAQRLGTMEGIWPSLDNIDHDNSEIATAFDNETNEPFTVAAKDNFCNLTANTQEASAEESVEVLEKINALSDDDKAIVRTRAYII